MNGFGDNIRVVVGQSPPVDSFASNSKESITLKINGLQYLFDPSKQVTSVRPQFMIPMAGRPGLVIQTFFQLRHEDPTIGELEGKESSYHIELNESESLDSEEEFTETLEEEEKEEKEDLEDMSFSDQGPSMQDGEGFNEEDPKESLQELLMIEEFLKEEKARKMWQKAKKEILESLERKGKKFPLLSPQLEAISYHSLLNK